MLETCFGCEEGLKLGSSSGQENTIGKISTVQLHNRELREKEVVDEQSWKLEIVRT